MSHELNSKEVLYKLENEDFDFNKGNINDYEYEYDEVFKKLRTALEIKEQGYNVFLIDDFSNEKLNSIKKYVKKIYEKREKPHDICYIIKDDEKCPGVLYLQCGNGIKIKEILQKLQDNYEEYTFEFYNSSSYKDKEDIIDNIQRKKNEMLSEIIRAAEKEGFDVKLNQNGFTFLPLQNGEAMNDKVFDALLFEEKDEIVKKVGNLKIIAQNVLNELKEIETYEIDKIKILMAKFYESKMSEFKEEYKKQFVNDEFPINYLDYVCKEIETNIVDNYSTSFEDDEENINQIINKYVINVIVDNSCSQNPHVIYEEDPSINNLMGSIEYENKNGGYSTDCSMIKSGSLLNANEGCIVLRANLLFSNPSSYYYLKKALLNEKVTFDFNRSYLDLLSIGGLRPGPINLNVKVILIGDLETYSTLYNYDEDFSKIFGVRAEFDHILKRDDHITKRLIGGIYNSCTKYNLRPLTDNAIKEVIKYFSRKAECKNKIYFDISELNNILMLSDNKIKNKDTAKIEDDEIRETLYNEDLIQRKIMEYYSEGKVLIDVNEKRIGQINGLSVIDTGYLSFGKPMKITCSCYKGTGNVFDIQKENKLSGSVHSKSVNILEGYINNLLGGYSKLPVDFHISFEQLYGMIDGDSASVAEVVCMISALSKIPIKQYIAVTGSINQFGEVQPIGGVNEKIEGFFNVCKLLDCTDNKGVIIPTSNVDNIVLNHDVENEIEKGKFNIYTMNKVDDAIEILMCDEKIDLDYVNNQLKKEIKKYINKNELKKII